MHLDLAPRQTPGAEVVETAPGAWRLRIPGGAVGQYRLAQLDDYHHPSLQRWAFPWRPPLRLHVRARVSANDLPGTWGFGLWNDPFTMSLGLGGMTRRLPALPNTAWFFYASPPNYLALRDSHPAVGMLAATFASPGIPPPLLALGSPALALLAWRPTARLLRRLVRVLVQEDAALLTADFTQWHTYAAEWIGDGVRFFLDGAPCFDTPIVPGGPLGLVLWIDNQYAAFPPDGRVRFGTLANEVAWLELMEIEVEGL